MTRICQESEGLPHDWTDFFPEQHLLAGLQPTRCRTCRNRHCCLALVDLPGLELPGQGHERQAHLARLLSPAEMDRLATFRLDKRRREWLGGRLAGKQALLLLTGTDHAAHTISILPDKHGRPRLTAPLPPPLPSLSISHSGTLAVAMASRSHHCGIDVQEIVPRIERLADRIGDPLELALLTQAIDSDTTTRLTMLWTAKEAAKKSLLSDRPTLFNGTRLRRISHHREGRSTFHLACALDRGEEAAAVIHVHRFGGYVLAITEQNQFHQPWEPR